MASEFSLPLLLQIFSLILHNMPGKLDNFMVKSTKMQSFRFTFDEDSVEEVWRSKNFLQIKVASLRQRWKLQCWVRGLEVFK
ncbi:hypothetical protein D5086_032248 [Populus alba]|uniref:Uncharacterized protein n=1 Tax=Populus alba TaxID=43335 RepID=A0ACC4AKS4_POPAL